ARSGDPAEVLGRVVGRNGLAGPPDQLRSGRGASLQPKCAESGGPPVLYNCAREDASRLLSSAPSSGCAAFATPHQTQCISGDVVQGAKRVSGVASSIHPSCAA